MTNPPPADSTIPLLKIDDLGHPQSSPKLPFRVLFADDEPIEVLSLLRVLPGRRLVGEGRWRGRPALAKIFIGRHSDKYWNREKQGIEALHAAGIATPGLIASGKLNGGSHALLTEFLAGASSLAEQWATVTQLPAGHSQALALLRPAFALIGRMHAAGFIHTDLHLGNLLDHKGTIYVIDGDGIRRANAATATLANLALLIAQLPVAWDSHLAPLIAAYCADQPTRRPDAHLLRLQIENARKRRLKQFLRKTLRDCSQFASCQKNNEFIAVVRSERGRLDAILNAPDLSIANGKLLKDGRTCTVALAETSGNPVVVKRYNLKNFGHTISRLWRPSRAWHSWLSGHRLAFHGIATPAPLALLEERYGPLRRRAFLLTDFCPGQNLLEHLDPNQAPALAEATAITTLFQTLHRIKVSHGDLKATNLLWHNDRIFVIDLDAMTQHSSAASHRKAWHRDRTRLLQNWPADSALHHWLDKHLP